MCLFKRLGPEFCRPNVLYQLRRVLYHPLVLGPLAFGAWDVREEREGL